MLSGHSRGAKGSRSPEASSGTCSGPRLPGNRPPVETLYGSGRSGAPRHRRDVVQSVKRRGLTLVHPLPAVLGPPDLDVIGTDPEIHRRVATVVDGERAWDALRRDARLLQRAVDVLRLDRLHDPRGGRSGRARLASSPGSTASSWQRGRADFCLAAYDNVPADRTQSIDPDNALVGRWHEGKATLFVVDDFETNTPSARAARVWS